jgi:transposase-like protein
MRRYRRGSEWAAILEEYKRSGMSVKSFCRERGLCATSIYRRRGKENRSPEFIELAHGDVSASYEISVEGVTLKVPSRESAARIAELMRAVRC